MALSAHSFALNAQILELQAENEASDREQFQS